MNYSVLVFLVLLSSCGVNNDFKAGIPQAKVDAPLEKDEKPICNPFGGSGDSNIKAALYEGNSSVKNFQDYININKKFKQSLYFSELNVPTRKWTDGFIRDNGIPLLNSKGEKFVEWFALDLTSSLVLQDNQEEGYYIFSSFADDGFFLDLQVGASWIRAIDFDLISPPTFHCYTTLTNTQVRAFRMTKDTKLKMHAGYFQGPREYITLQLYMKKIANLADGDRDFIEKNMTKPECDVKRGFELLKSENYFLENPPNC